ncbi:uncharacterized protein EI90DRAFT_3090721 [Cantharellus anzutake]|uniref:uncharacterized protein n=1 Tax=Cantharellus anzutake TaxID=1750568 RepID=UPI0019033436|nr:uncharacterized protein EI90DRAFT_3090721 [Cantharellus anzutake]KAF8314343.1 hypothetical protein EI90DRAFT_3090721 [Cantharellus anzutake]
MRELDEIESSDSDSEPEPTTTQVEDPSTSHQSLESSLVAQGRRFVLTADSFDSTTTPAQRGRAVVGVGVVRSIRPQIIFRLTRLASAVCTAGPAPEGSQDASNVDKKRDLSRILRHVDKLKALGITVLLDEQDGEIGDRLANMKLVKTPISFYHTLKINLDLSAVVALCSEITHMGPPENPSIAEERFRPWRQLLLSDSDGVEEALDDGGGDDDDGVDNGGNSVEHARSLIAQSIQEAKLPLLEEIRQKAIDAIAFHSGRGVPSPSSSNYSVGPSERSPSIEFWTTPEVKHRAFGIVDKIGGQNERARARALFEAPSPIEGEEHCASGSQSFWTSSRYPKDFIPSLHVQLFPSDVPESFYLSPASPDSGTVERDASGSELKGAEFWTHLGRTAASLAGLHSGQPISNPLDSSQLPSTESRTKPNSKGLRSAITKHTALSFLWGSQMHMTTVTANRASVKALLREMDATAELKPFTNPLVSEEGGVTREEIREEAAIWIIRPRSLAEASVVTPPPPRSHDFTRLIS